MNENRQQIEEDEIDLRELFKTIMDKKWFIMGFTLIVTILAVVYAYMKTPIYQVKSNVQVGYIGEDLLTDPKTLVKVLNIEFNVEDKLHLDKPFLSEVSSISVNKKLKNFIEIKVNAISNDEAIKLNKKVAQYITEKYKTKVEHFIFNNDAKIKNIKNEIKNIKNAEIKNIKREIERIKIQKIVSINQKINFLKIQKINSLKKKITFHTEKLKEYKQSINDIYETNKKLIDPSTLAISSMQMVNYQNLILNSQNKIEDLKIIIEKINTESIPSLKIEKNNIENDTLRNLNYKLTVTIPNKILRLKEKITALEYLNTNQNIQNSRLIGDYIVKSYPIKPKKRLIVIVAFITSFILAIFLSFLINFIQGFKEEK